VKNAIAQFGQGNLSRIAIDTTLQVVFRTVLSISHKFSIS